MKHGAFLRFIAPSLAAMVLFIALPIVSVLIQSMHAEHEQVLKVVENCVPFAGCTETTSIDQEAMRELREERPLGRFVGGDIYAGRNHLAFDSVGAAWAASDGIGDFLSRLMNLRFYKALAFTLTYTFVVTPFCIVIGLCVALALNTLPKLLKGPTIFLSILPMMITPLIGGLVLYWMLDSRGILGSALIYLTGDPGLSLKASPVLTWVMLIVYGVWSSIPFAFVVYYAGLQTVPEDTLESAVIDGASRWERIRYVIIPHLAPLTTFIALIQLMDNFRVLEPIVSFSAEANAISLSYAILNDLRGTETALFGSAAATSMLTIIGVAVLLSPVIWRTWRDFTSRNAH
ncbi:sugar ABC transporter permease [Jannaschia sp. Os4]|uniref:carbohydrate ABC transporter permease n=1 Tax=Jannaschia sp. Os4 TaxID=2807617 RepID=UPI0019392EF9|nr:sugar ABC transporter permease [Jannaschia sp. Os4]MBM2577679.1 sugar ABC transporter permease [Jannaschia sp. Os4]